MPPRFSYWTILAGGLPTAFRATDRDELLPTFQRLREKHPDAMLKWFARGRLWESPDEARADLERKRRPSRHPVAAASSAGRGPRRDGVSGSGQRQDKPRDRNWRPGGEHRDPRQKFADAKKARNADRRKQRFERKHGTFKPRDGDARARFETPRPPDIRPSADRRDPTRGSRPGGPKPARTGKSAFRGGPSWRRGADRRSAPRKPGRGDRREAGGARRPEPAGDRRPKPAGDRRPFERAAFHRKDPRPRQPRDTRRLDVPAPPDAGEDRRAARAAQATPTRSPSAASLDRDRAPRALQTAPRYERGRTRGPRRRARDGASRHSIDSTRPRRTARHPWSSLRGPDARPLLARGGPGVRRSARRCRRTSSTPHRSLASQFFDAFEEALLYDFELTTVLRESTRSSRR